MSNIQVQFKRGDTATLNNTPITDGMIYFNTDNKHIYMDNGSTSRLEYHNDMSNFMDNTVISNLVPKSNDVIKNPNVINRIIGDSYIGGISVLEAINNLNQNKALFETVWENPDPQPFTTKTITTQGIYNFYFILFGEKTSDAIAEEEIDNCMILNNSIIFTQFGNAISHGRYIKNVRKITVASDNDNNITTFTFGQYGDYLDGEISSYDNDSQNNFIPHKIIGISSI